MPCPGARQVNPFTSDRLILIIQDFPTDRPSDRARTCDHFGDREDRVTLVF